ncbi:hypothetical protein ABMY26_35915 (plasmid) [Azospirillum sp. HJ39]
MSSGSGSRVQGKRITVKPGETLPLQMHHHRAEHWIVVEGVVLVTIEAQSGGCLGEYDIIRFEAVRTRPSAIVTFFLSGLEIFGRLRSAH